MSHDLVMNYYVWFSIAILLVMTIGIIGLWVFERIFEASSSQTYCDSCRKEIDYIMARLDRADAKRHEKQS